MRAYGFNPETKEYEREVECQIDPLETIQKGFDVWLLPANSTWDKPLKPKDGFKIIYNGKWVYKKIPEPEPKPEPTQEEKEQRVRWKRDGLISSITWRIERYNEQIALGLSTTDTEEIYKKILAYRQYLRDFTKQENWFEKEPLNFEEL